MSSIDRLSPFTQHNIPYRINPYIYSYAVDVSSVLHIPLPDSIMLSLARPSPCVGASAKSVNLVNVSGKCKYISQYLRCVCQLLNHWCRTG
jgi:hypothetical protein